MHTKCAHSMDQTTKWVSAYRPGFPWIWVWLFFLCIFLGVCCHMVSEGLVSHSVLINFQLDSYFVHMIVFVLFLLVVFFFSSFFFRFDLILWIPFSLVISLPFPHIYYKSQMRFFLLYSSTVLMRFAFLV